MIYLDNAATTQIHPYVLSEMMPYLTSEYGNAGGLYGLGHNAKTAVDFARERVAKFLGANPENVVFTSSGCEANSLAISVAHEFREPIRHGGVLTSDIEHDSVLNAARAYNDQWAVLPRQLHADTTGQVQINEIAIGNSTLVSVMYENNETGIVNKVHNIADVCKKHNVIFHVDAVQAAGHIPLNVESIGCDLLSISSHKIHGPKGVGALYVSDRVLERLRPSIHGGANQEWGKRGGTENVAGIVGFGAACERLVYCENRNLAWFCMLRDGFLDVLETRLPSYAYNINGLLDCNLGKTLNICFYGVDAETLVLALAADGICVSAGSACTSHESKPSHVLKAMGLSDEDARCSIRISFSELNTEEEVLGAAVRIAERVLELGGGK